MTLTITKPNPIKEAVMEPTVQQAEPKVEQPIVETPKTPESIVARVAQFKKPEPSPVPTPAEDKFNINELDAEIEKITDPTLKNQFLGLKKSLVKGENQKYQEISTLRKQYEQRLAEVTTWTPERIKQEMARPDFVQAANEILRTQSNSSTDDEVSGLSATERERIRQAEEKANSAQAQLAQLQVNQIHSKLQSKYANYDQEAVASDVVQLASGKVSNDVVLEAIWKARDYDSAVQRAYELGLQDKVNLNTEKVNAMTHIPGGTNQSPPTMLERQPGETTQAFMLRSYAEHAKKR